MGKGWRGEGSLAVLRRQAKPYGDWLASAPCQRPLGAATISEIYFGICSNVENRVYPPEIECDAISGVFDLVDIRGKVVIGEGIKDKAPGIFLGDKLGRGNKNSPRFDIALDPIDGTTNMSKGLPNSLSVMAAAHVPEGESHGMINIPSFYAEKLSYGPIVKEAIVQTRIPSLTLSMDFGEIMTHAAAALKKRVSELVVVVPELMLVLDGATNMAQGVL